MVPIDMTGEVFGRLTVLRRAGADRHGQATWECLCQCSALSRRTIIVLGGNLRRGLSKSCGCQRNEETARRKRIHGCSKTSATYRIWCNMVNRCTNPNNGCFERYGGRGVGVCSRWRQFPAFFADMGERPAGLSIDRIDNDGGYWCGKSECPECAPLGRKPNCRWATTKEQNRNTRVNTVFTVDGITRCLAEWAEVVGVCPTTMAQRFRRWTPADAISRPVRVTRRASRVG